MSPLQSAALVAVYVKRKARAFPVIHLVGHMERHTTDESTAYEQAGSWCGGVVLWWIHNTVDQVVGR
jgi:hypothetical protein